MVTKYLVVCRVERKGPNPVPSSSAALQNLLPCLARPAPRTWTASLLSTRQGVQSPTPPVSIVLYQSVSNLESSYLAAMSCNIDYVLARVAELRGDAGEVPMDSQPSKKRRVETPESIDTPMNGDASEADDLEDGVSSGEVSESASQEDTDGDTDADESVSTGPQKNSAEERAEILGLLGVSDDSLSYGDALLSLSRPYKEDDRALRSFLAQPVEQVQSLVPLDAFMQKDGDEWDTHCLKVDQEWSKLVEQLSKLQPSIKLKELSKPSGPLGAPVCCMCECSSVIEHHQLSILRGSGKASRSRSPSASIL